MPESLNRGAAALLIRFLQAVAGAFGAGTLLYGIGFLILRAHYDLLGIPGFLVWNSGELAEEGGRFVLIHLAAPLNKLAALDKLMLTALVVFTAIAGLVPRVPIVRGALVRINRTIRFGFFRAPNACLLLSLLLTALLLNTVWQALRPANLLFCTDDFSERFRDTGARESVYTQVVFRTLVAAGLSLFLVWVVWPLVAGTGRILIGIQVLLAGLALSIWPSVYGKLAYSRSYPSIRYATQPESEKLLLLAKTDKGYAVWNAVDRRLEILPDSDKQRAIIGPKEPLNLNEAPKCTGR